MAEQALALVQSLDPPGIAARDLRECLLAQLTPDMLFYEEMKTLITNHLEDLRDNRLPLIQKVTGYSIETIQEAWDELRKLNPKPGAQFAETFVPTVTPDVHGRARRRRQVQGHRRRQPHADAAHQPVLSRAAGERHGDARKSGSTSSGRSTPPSG